MPVVLNTKNTVAIARRNLTTPRADRLGFTGESLTVNKAALEAALRRVIEVGIIRDSERGHRT